MTIDSARRVQSLYVPASDGVRLAIDVSLPVERIAWGEQVGTAFRATRYHRAKCAYVACLDDGFLRFHSL